jgi:hypothetical protein
MIDLAQIFLSPPTFFDFFPLSHNKDGEMLLTVSPTARIALLLPF